MRGGGFYITISKALRARGFLSARPTNRPQVRTSAQGAYERPI